MKIKEMQTYVMDMFAEHELLILVWLELSHILACTTFQFYKAHIRFCDWPGKFPSELPLAVLEKFPGFPTASQEEVRVEVYSL